MNFIFGAENKNHIFEPGISGSDLIKLMYAADFVTPLWGFVLCGAKNYNHFIPSGLGYVIWQDSFEKCYNQITKTP